MAHGEIGTGVHGGKDDETETLMAPRPVEEQHGLSVVVYRPPIVALMLLGSAKV